MIWSLTMYLYRLNMLCFSKGHTLRPLWARYAPHSSASLWAVTYRERPRFVCPCSSDALSSVMTHRLRQGWKPSTVHKRLKSADAYVMCTPEYSLAPSAALFNLLSHFGSSVFGFKPSAIASYSAGQWGGRGRQARLVPCSRSWGACLSAA